MTPFVSGALGALAVLLGVAALRRIFWMRRLHSLRSRMPLRFLFRRLGTRPAQEQVITAEADALAAEVHGLRRELRAAREEVAELVAAPALDAAAVQAAIDSRLARLTALREKLAEGLARIHATLEPAQRATLAAMIRRGAHAHGHRCGHAHGHG